MVGLIGPDGVGKSTLLAILAGAKRVQAADRIRVFGGDFTQAAHRASVCARIAYMPQGLGRNLYPDLPVRENIAFFSRLFGQATERARRIGALLEATNLAPFADRPAGKLSGGMRQKLRLCCALIHDPDLLVLDEPTTGVDPMSRRQFWDLVDRIRARRPDMSVIVATASMEEAERFGQLIAMNDGAVIATGTPAEIRERTGTEMRPNIPPMQAGKTDIAISAVSLTRRFGDFQEVDHVSFGIAQGEISGFLGSNGCGKTTTMRMLTGLMFGNPVRGSVAALAAGTLIYVYATTAYGMLISVFANTQIAALFGTALLTVIPATQFSGMLSPVASLSGMGAVFGHVFPMSYYLPIAVGTFTKSLGFAELTRTMLTLAALVPALLGLSLLMLPKQER